MALTSQELRIRTIADRADAITIWVIQRPDLRMTEVYTRFLKQFEKILVKMTTPAVTSDDVAEFEELVAQTIAEFMRME